VSLLDRTYRRAIAGPRYEPDAGDLRDLELAGVALPVRASVALLASTALLLIDHLGLLGPLLPSPVGGVSALSAQRFVLFLVVPVAIVVLGFRDALGRYALQLGDWRAGLALLLAGLVVMTPIILALAGLPQVRGFYGATPEPLTSRILNGLVELIPAEFLLRGFLMFTLWRRIGPLALVVVQVPFILVHVGKPDVELWSTFIGGAVFAWLDWRTSSILWSALGHVYVLTLMLVAVGGAVPG
jgi:uncharacterized protein